MTTPTTAADLRALAEARRCTGCKRYFCEGVVEALLWAADELERLTDGTVSIPVGRLASLEAASRACEAREAVKQCWEGGAEISNALCEAAWQDAVEAEREWKRLKAASDA